MASDVDAAIQHFEALLREGEHGKTEVIGALRMTTVTPPKDAEYTARLVAQAEAIAALAPITPSGRRYLVEVVATSYAIGLPPDSILQQARDFVDLGFFDPARARGAETSQYHASREAEAMIGPSYLGRVGNPEADARRRERAAFFERWRTELGIER